MHADGGKGDHFPLLSQETQRITSTVPHSMAKIWHQATAIIRIVPPYL
jgi:hypothetical protein